MSATNRNHLSVVTSAPEHPAWCSPSESCNEFSHWDHAIHRGPVETFTIDGLTSDDWESNDSTVQASLQSIENTEGGRFTAVEISIDSETGNLELDPEKMRALAAWLNAKADQFEQITSVP